MPGIRFPVKLEQPENVLNGGLGMPAFRRQHKQARMLEQFLPSFRPGVPRILDLDPVM